VWRATLTMALRALRRNLARSVLTTLGIIIGVASVIALVTLGQATTARVTADISNLGSNLLIVTPGADRRGPLAVQAPSFTAADSRALRAELAGIGGLAPTSSASVLVVAGNANASTVAYGSTNDFFTVRGYRMETGRPFSESEQGGGAPVCVLGATPRRKLFGATEPVGATIRVGRLACLVVGVMEAKGQAAIGPDQDDLVVLPLVTLQRRVLGSTDVGSFFVGVATDQSISRVQEQVRALLRERRRLQPGQPDDFTVLDAREIAQTLGSVTGVLTVLLGAVAGVSLLVGGIGIMNIMLVSVTERTREIGIRLAIGALPREVLMQFLVEAVLLCAIGGAIGLALGLVGSYAVTRGFGLPFEINALLVGSAVTFSAGIGVAFGWLPARRAARLDPIEALRHE
jgi:putative ABC transport system permease protein